jgi:hypothetical protein
MTATFLRADYLLSYSFMFTYPLTALVWPLFSPITYPKNLRNRRNLRIAHVRDFRSSFVFTCPQRARLDAFSPIPDP